MNPFLIFTLLMVLLPLLQHLRESQAATLLSGMGLLWERGGDVGRREVMIYAMKVGAA